MMHDVRKYGGGAGVRKYLMDHFNQLDVLMVLVLIVLLAARMTTCLVAEGEADAGARINIHDVLIAAEVYSFDPCVRHPTVTVVLISEGAVAQAAPDTYIREVWLFSVHQLIW